MLAYPGFKSRYQIAKEHYKVDKYPPTGKINTNIKANADLFHVSKKGIKSRPQPLLNQIKKDAVAKGITWDDKWDRPLLEFLNGPFRNLIKPEEGLEAPLTYFYNQLGIGAGFTRLLLKISERVKVPIEKAKQYWGLSDTSLLDAFLRLDPKLLEALSSFMPSYFKKVLSVSEGLILVLGNEIFDLEEALLSEFALRYPKTRKCQIMVNKVRKKYNRSIGMKF